MSTSVSSKTSASRKKNKSHAKSASKETHPVAIVPASVRELLGPPPVLMTEDAGKYDAILARLAAEIEPATLEEWFLLNDIACVNWEILRYRRAMNAELKIRYPEIAHHLASEAETDFYDEDEPSFEAELVKRKAYRVRRGATAAVKKFDNYMRKVGLDLKDVASATIIASMEEMLKFEKLIESLERRRGKLWTQMLDRKALGRRYSAANIGSTIEHERQDAA